MKIRDVFGLAFNKNKHEASNRPRDGFDALKDDVPFKQTQEEATKKAEQADSQPTEVRDDAKNDSEQEKIELFNNFVDFFKKDGDIKRELVALAPNEQFTHNDDPVRYSNRLYEGTKEIIDDLSSMMDSFYQSDTIEKRLEQIEADVVNAGANSDKLARVYQDDFASMSEGFAKRIHQEAVGYIDHDLHQFDDEAVSINEILHLVHSSIVNDEKILHSLPVLESSEERYRKTVLYGTNDSENPVAREIYNQIKNSKESFSDIVSLPDRTLMMIRDRGHALTLDIEKEKGSGDYYVNYFIPKICNVDKVNQLPGVRRVAKKDGQSQVLEFTTGIFRVRDEADVASSVTSFITMVPTDKDIVYDR